MSDAPDTVPDRIPVVPRLANIIELIRRPVGDQPAFELAIDGKSFPYYLAIDPPPTIEVRDNAPPQITFTLLAEAVHVVDDYLLPTVGSPLARAETEGSMHPALTWCTDVAAEQHRRALPGPQGGTRCGLPGPLRIAARTLPRCPDCFPPEAG